MTDLWLPGAQRLRSTHGGGRMAGGAPRVVWHRTAGGTFVSNSAYLRQKGFEPHLLWDPVSGAIGQYLPADVGGYALEHPAGTAETNCMGRFCIQIEVVDHGLPFLITDSPMRGWDQIRPWLAQLGIPEVWPHGTPPPLGSRDEAPVGVWRTTAGHYSHSQVPANHHTDPGRMDPAVMFPPIRPRPTPPAQPNQEEFVMATKAEVKDAVREVMQDLQGKRTADHKDNDPAQLSIADVLNKLDALPDAIAAAVVRAQQTAAAAGGR